MDNVWVSRRVDPRKFYGTLGECTFSGPLGKDLNFWGFRTYRVNYLLFENGISVFFLGLWWEPHLKTGFPCLFGLFWKIMPISSIWKRDFPFFGLVMGTSGNNANIFYLKTGFPFFWACDGNLWKIISISSIWKRDFRCFFWLVIASSGK